MERFKELSLDEAFLKTLTDSVFANLSNEHYGAEEMAKEVGISRSQIHRKLKKINGKSVTQFIREIRLEEALRLLKKEVGTASEIAYNVGFGSPTYFNKCFHEYFGYPPGEVKKRKGTTGELQESFERSDQTFEQKVEDLVPRSTSEQARGQQKASVKRKLSYYLIAGLLVIILGIVIRYEMKDKTSQEVMVEKPVSIAILPFKNMSLDPNQEVMCDGLTEEIIHYLSVSKVFDKVISRSSVMTFKESEKTVPEIAELLNVNFILEGSYRQSGNRMRITAKLIEASTDNHLWTEIYERPVGDIFDVQSDIAKKIAYNLKGKLSIAENELIAKKSTDKIEAYNLYLRGRFFWHKRGDDMKKSIYYFKKALELDSTYALAYAGLAESYMMMAWWEIYPEEEGREKCKTFLEKALLIDDQIAQAHATLGKLLTWDKKFHEAEKAFKQAIELNPGYATGHYYYASFLQGMGRIKEARKELDLAVMYNPLSSTICGMSGWFNYFDGQINKALEDAQLADELADHTMLSIRVLIFYSYFNLGLYDEATRSAQTLVWYTSFKTADTLEIRNEYLDSGINGVIRWLINFELSKSNLEYIVLANLNMFIDNKQEAIKWLEIGYNKNYKYIDMDIKYHHVFKSLRSHPRFIALLKKMDQEREKK